MNIIKTPFFKKLTFFCYLFLVSQWAQAEGEPLVNSDSDDRQMIKIVDVPEGPSLFVVAGMSYINKRAYCEVDVEAFHPGRLDYSLTSIKGDILFRDHKRLDQGLNHLGVSFADCPNGLYQLDLQLEQEHKTLIIEKTAQNTIKASLVSHIE